MGSPHDGGGSSDGSSAGDDASKYVEGSTAESGSTDAGTTDGGTTDGGTAEGGPRDIGSCCSAQATPGCDDPNDEVCVCKDIPSCCTTAWTTACALIVQEKYCQPGVRECVYGTDAGQWAQTSCATSWTSNCDTVAIYKCDAAQGCF